MMHVATLSVIHIVCCTMALSFLLGVSVVGPLKKKRLFTCWFKSYNRGCNRLVAMETFHLSLQRSNISMVTNLLQPRFRLIKLAREQPFFYSTCLYTQ